MVKELSHENPTSRVVSFSVNQDSEVKLSIVLHSDSRSSVLFNVVSSTSVCRGRFNCYPFITWCYLVSLSSYIIRTLLLLLKTRAIDTVVDTLHVVIQNCHKKVIWTSKTSIIRIIQFYSHLIVWSISKFGCQWFSPRLIKLLYWVVSVEISVSVHFSHAL